jgi:hypothetical protein
MNPNDPKSNENTSSFFFISFLLVLGNCPYEPAITVPGPTLASRPYQKSIEVKDLCKNSACAGAGWTT